MVACASDLLAALGLPHRLVTLCTGDLGFGAARTVDLSGFLEQKYREISSVSNTRDFQARRAKIRYKEEENILAHTLNGSRLGRSDDDSYYGKFPTRRRQYYHPCRIAKIPLKG